MCAHNWHRACYMACFTCLLCRAPMKAHCEQVVAVAQVKCLCIAGHSNYMMCLCTRLLL
jgi:hypothetical protein